MADATVTLIPNEGTSLALTDELRIDLAGVDFGPSVMETALATGPDITGGVPGTQQRPPVEMSIPIQVKGTDGTTYLAAAHSLQEAVARLAKHKGFVRFSLDFGLSASEALDREVVGSVTLTPPDDKWLEAHRTFARVLLTVTCNPEWFAVQAQVYASGTLTGQRVHEVNFDGTDAPAFGGVVDGPGEIEITDLAGQRRRFAEIGYSSDTTSQIEFLAADFELGEPATLEADADAFDGNAIQVTPVVPSWQVVGYLRDLPHRGAWAPRTRAKFSAASDAEVQLRLSYREGSGVWNDVAVRTLKADDPAAYFETAFPQINRMGSAETMDVRVEVYAATPDATNAFRFNGLTLFPATDLYAIARGVPIIRKAAGMVEFDDFPASGGAASNLAGRVAPLGGTWAERGDVSPRWEFVPNAGVAARTFGTADADLDTGAFGELGTTDYTDATVIAGVDTTLAWSRLQESEVGVYARWVDASNYIRATIRTRRRGDGKRVHWLRVRKEVAGVPETLANVPLERTPAARSGFTVQGVLALIVSADGKWRLEAGKLGGDSLETTRVVAKGQDNDLATGALATGKTGIYSAATESNQDLHRCFAFATHDQAQATQLTDVVRENGSGVFTHREAYAGETGPNKVLNPDFEANDVYWNAAESNATRSTAESNTGLASLEIEVLNTAGSSGVQLGVPGSSLGHEPMIVGSTYRVRVWVKAPNGQAMRMTSGENIGVDPEQFTPVSFVGTGDWQEVDSGSFSALQEQLPLFFGPPATSGTPTFYLDDVSIGALELTQPIPVYRGSYIWLPPGAGRLAIKLRAGDSDAEPDVLTDHGGDPVESIRVLHRRAYTGLSDELA